MKICFLTQTAHDISDYYKEFFRKKDLYFITFKSHNEKASAFLPKSSWSDGRNKLWELVKDKYDYYVFMDDGLKFFNFNSTFAFSPIAAYLCHKLYKKNFVQCYQLAKAEYFLNKLEYYLQKYKPEILSVSQSSWDPNSNLDTLAMRHNSFVRRMAYFDAQFTVMSNYAANKLLPYDTKLSGWWSAQIPIYLYSYHVFASRAVNLVELGVTNNFHTGNYVENYNGFLDCRRMIQKISESTGKDYSALAGNSDIISVDFHYEVENMRDKIDDVSKAGDYKANYDSTLKGLENLLHGNLS